MSSNGRRRKSPQAECDAWNSTHIVGEEVIVARDNGEKQRTTTRSEAYVCDSGYAVIFLEGVRGYYLLNRVTSVSA